MSTALTILSILGAVSLSLLLSRVPALGLLSTTRAFAALRLCVLAAMVAAMGFRIGRTEEVIRSAGTLGLASLLFAAATMAGTLLVLSISFRLRRTGGGTSVPPWVGTCASAAVLLGDSLFLPGMLAAGFLAGFLLPVFPGADAEQLITGLLYTHLVFIGLDLGASRIRPARMLSHPDLLLRSGQA